MEHSPETVVIHILTDSRGAGLQRLLSQEDCELDFQVTVKSGATFQQLADLSKHNKDNFAYQIMAGGICSLTSKTGKYIDYTRDSTKLKELKASISDTLATLGTRVTIATITMAMPSALIQVCSTHICMVQCTHLITTGGTPHLYNRVSSVLVNSLQSGENNM